MKKILLLSLLSFSLFAQQSADETPYNIALEKANHALHELHSMIRGNMQAEKQKGGILSTARFCANKSYANIEELNKEFEEGISIKRVSLANRNPKSYPEEDEKKVLEAFTLLADSLSYLPHEIVQLKEDGVYKIYFPSVMSSKNCKACHGLANQTNLEVQQFMKKRYPNDKAFGFKTGQIRGAVIVTVKPNVYLKNDTIDSK
ncbi:MAG: DUF3365 domain-containing protein [Arcobacteraceae bacterium]|jgi:hypothetical protein